MGSSGRTWRPKEIGLQWVFAELGQLEWTKPMRANCLQWQQSKREKFKMGLVACGRNLATCSANLKKAIVNSGEIPLNLHEQSDYPTEEKTGLVTVLKAFAVCHPII